MAQAAVVIAVLGISLVFAMTLILIDRPAGPGSRSARIVGIIDGCTALAGQAERVPDGRAADVVRRQPIVTSVGVRGAPAEVPDGYRTIPT
jgi:hypothetical protein